MPRFVILEHDHPELHWDFMVETGAVLRTWRLPRPPELGGEPMPAQALADHRLAYLDYEGPISGARGTVRRWDWGEYEFLAPAAGDIIKVRLQGQRLRGIAILQPAGQPSAECLGPLSTLHCPLSTMRLEP